MSSSDIKLDDVTIDVEDLLPRFMSWGTNPETMLLTPNADSVQMTVDIGKKQVQIVVLVKPGCASAAMMRSLRLVKFTPYRWAPEQVRLDQIELGKGIAQNKDGWATCFPA